MGLTGKMIQTQTEYVCMLGKYHQVGHLITLGIIG